MNNGMRSPADFETGQRMLNEAGVQETRGASKIRVRAAAGVTQLTAMSRPASSLPRELVIPITPAFDAE